MAGALSQHGPWLEAWNGRHERKQTLTVVISSSAALRGPVKECVPLIDGQNGAVEIDFALFQGGAPMLEAAGLLQHDVVCSVAGEPTRDFKAEGVKQLISVQQEPCEVGLLRRFAIQYDLMGFVVRHTVDGVPEDGPPSLSLTALQWTHFQGEKAQPWERDFLARGHSSAGAFASEVAPSAAPSPIVIEQPPGVSPSVSSMPEEQG